MNRMCTKQRFLLNAEFGSEVWGAPLLIRLDGCHAELFSNEQGQELDINLMKGQASAKDR